MNQLSNNIEFDVTQILKRVENRRKYLVILFILLPIYGVIFNPHKSTLHLTLYLIAFFVVFLINILYYSLKKRYILEGKLILNCDFIQVNKEKILIKNIKEMSVKYIGFKGEDFPLSAVGISTFGFKDGADNLFEIKDDNGVITSLTFLSKNKNDKKRIKNILVTYKNAGIILKNNIF